MNNTLIANKKIAIVGGGPVGLTTALLLQRKGARVTLYERDADAAARISGGSLDLHLQTGQLALKEAGILDEFYRLSYPPEEKMTTIDGKVFAEDFLSEETRFLKPEIDRNELRSLLCRHIDPGVIAWDRKLVRLERQEDKYLLHFEHGPAETADIVIGANGGRCNLRSFLNDARPQYTGTYLVQGVVDNLREACPAFYELCGDSNIMVIAEGHALSTHYIANGALVFDISFRQPEHWFEEHHVDLGNKQVVADFLNGVFKNWSPVYKELFSASREFNGYPMRYIPLDPWKAHHHITLIGDAAHLMPPFAGIGVNIGLVDALTLTRNLSSDRFDSVDAAIADYEATMFGYAKAALEASLSAELHIHSDKSNDELLQGRDEWNETLANAEPETIGHTDVYAAFQKKVTAASPLGGTLKFIVGERIFFIDGTNGENHLTERDDQAACTITISPDDFQQLISGKLSTTAAFMNRKLKVAGDMGLAFKIRDLL